jgi:hypothetical protein
VVYRGNAGFDCDMNCCITLFWLPFNSQNKRHPSAAGIKNGAAPDLRFFLAAATTTSNNEATRSVSRREPWFVTEKVLRDG